MRMSRRRALGTLGGLVLASSSIPSLSVFGAEEFRYTPDQLDAILLRKISDQLADVPGVLGIGPISNKTQSCRILVEKPIPSLQFEVDLNVENRNLKIKLNQIPVDRSSIQLFGNYFGGKMRGGDACRNVAYSDHGTITVTGNFRIDGIRFDDACLSCWHVLYYPVGGVISNPKYGECMDLLWSPQVPSNGKWVDIAVAKLRNSTIDKPNTLRALREITGVKQPAKFTRVSKFGTGTGLTSGRDLGLALWPVDPSDTSTRYLVRIVSGYFGARGDSGAAIVDGRRNLVGILFGGTGRLDETWYVAAVPEGDTPVDSALSAFKFGFV